MGVLERKHSTYLVGGCSRCGRFVDHTRGRMKSCISDDVFLILFKNSRWADNGHLVLESGLTMSAYNRPCVTVILEIRQGPSA